MKNLVIILMTFGTMLMASMTSQAQVTSGNGVMVLKSSIVCGMCKDTIEKGLAYEKGVKSAFVDVDENTITVHYKPKKISEKEVKEAINKLGYVAGDMKPTQAQYDTLHGCCKADGVCE